MLIDNVPLIIYSLCSSRCGCDAISRSDTLPHACMDDNYILYSQKAVTSTESLSDMTAYKFTRTVNRSRMRSIRVRRASR